MGSWVEQCVWGLMAGVGLVALLANLLVLATIRQDRALHTVANLCIQVLPHSAELWSSSARRASAWWTSFTAASASR
jgi:hypothetical protein